jgi:hypothetical protein
LRRFRRPGAWGYDRPVNLRRRRPAAAAAFALLALLAELTGRALTMRLDAALHVDPLATPTTRYYPFLLAGVRLLAALVVAAAVWRALKAHAAARAGERLLGRIGRRPRLRVTLSLRLWACSFAATSLWYLVQNDAVRVSAGRWPLLAPWLHTYALPVFACCSLMLALAWQAVSRWLADVEHYAATTLARAARLLRASPLPPSRRTTRDERAPRRLHGLDFESRPPPLPA